jgi:two-component system nitrogen regulation sensor histidine kinase NtrY
MPADGQSPPQHVPPPAPARSAVPLALPRRFRRRLLIVLAAVGLLPLLVLGSLGRSLLEGALAVAPPVGPLMGQAAAALDGTPGQAPLAAQLRAAEAHLMQADLARRLLLEMAPVSFLLALSASALLVGVGAWLLGRRLSRPIETLAAAMARYGRGELDAAIEPSGRGDELDFLAVELNRMGRELARQRARLQVTEALAAWRDAARALAHDLKNPLTAMRMALGRLTRPGRSEGAVVEAVSLLQEELDVLIRMSQTFTAFARLPAPQRRPVDLAALVTDLGTLYEPESAPARLVIEIAARPLVSADPDQLRRALGNLIKNAIEASRAAAGGAGTITLAVAPGDAAGSAEVRIRDQGKGLAAPLEGADLMRGLSSAKAGGERGLGLPIAHKIIHDHGGRLRLLPAATGGALAVVELPVEPAVAPAVESPVAPTATAAAPALARTGDRAGEGSRP